MQNSLESIAAQVERALAEVDAERLGRALGDADAERTADVLARHASAFDDGRVRAVLSLAATKEHAPHELAALAAQLVRLIRLGHFARVHVDAEAARSVVASVGERRSLLGELITGVGSGRPPFEGYLTAFDARASTIVHARREAAQRAEFVPAPLLALAAGDLDQPREDGAAAADALLADTEEVAREACAYLAARAGFELRTPLDVLASLRAAELDDAVRVGDRPRRVAELVAPIGFAKVLEQRASIAGARSEITLDGAVLFPRLDGPRMLVSNDARGVVGEVAFLLTIGRALSPLVAHPATPSPLRRPRSDVVGAMLGVFVARAALDRRQLARATLIPNGVLERVRRTAAAYALLRARVAAAAVLSQAGAPAEAALHRATFVEWPSSIAVLATSGARAGAELEGYRLGLGLVHALRERFDEDFLRHPGARELLDSVLRRHPHGSVSRLVEELSLGEHAGMELWQLFEGRYR